jgi:epoxyqueuosine reductase
MKRELRILAGRGINVFASAAIADLPEELKSYLPGGYRSLLIFGHGGRTLWENLPQPLDPARHPVDNYALENVRWFARVALGEAEPLMLFPSPEVVIPLQRLGRALNLARQSWLGLDTHPEYGVWFAYRAVVLTRQLVEPTGHPDFASPCDSCVDRPCRHACPAQAVAESFNLPACADHRLSENSPCADSCLSRLACPYQAQHRYGEAQLRYHMGRPAHLQALATYKTGL